MIRAIAKKLHILMGMVLICITGIAHSAPLPEYYGVYAVDGGKLVEIKNVGRLYEFSRNVQFIFFDKRINLLSDSIELRQSVFVRNRVVLSQFGPSKPSSVSEVNEWTTNKAAPPVEIRIKPIPGQPEQVYAVPRESLPPGAYSISFDNRSGVGYFYVDKESVLRDLNSGLRCVDLKVDPNGLWKDKEVPCNRESAPAP